MKSKKLNLFISIGLFVVALIIALFSNFEKGTQENLATVIDASPEINWSVVDELNLREIQEMYPKEYELYGSQGILDLGNMACNSADYGTTVDDMPRISLEYGVELGLLEAVFSTWIASYCPENEPKFLNN
jgi:hypothetical protein